MNELFIYLGLLLLLLLLLVLYLRKRPASEPLSTDIKELLVQNTELKTKLLMQESELLKLKEANSCLNDEKEGLLARLASLEAKLEAKDVLSTQSLKLKNEQLEFMQANLLKKQEELKTLSDFKDKSLKELKHEMGLVFNELSSKGLKSQSENFAKEQEKTLLNLQKHLINLQKNIQEDSEKRSLNHGELNTQIKLLFEKSFEVSKSANSLSEALKGSAKVQGDWGESVLSVLLEQSGLKQGLEYELQYTIKSEDGANLRPDALINLPEKRVLILDSKVSLNAYVRFYNSKGEERKKALKEHLKALKNHIDELSGKYSLRPFYSRHGISLSTAEFAVMFVPIDAALNEAILSDSSLLAYAYAKNVLLVNQVTLFPVLKMIDLLMQNVAKDENKDQIYEALGKMLAKFDGFVKDLKNIGKNLDSLQANYNLSYNKLVDGKGSLLSKKENIEKLLKKVSTTKVLETKDLKDDIFSTN